MANERISDLPNLGDVASDDEIAIVDVSAGATKKATIADAVGDYGNTVYPRLSNNNTMTGVNTFEQPLTIESTTSNMLRLQNTVWGGVYAQFGQQDDGEGVLQLPSGLQYVFSESGSEAGNSVLRRDYADTVYARPAVSNVFTALNTTRSFIEDGNGLVLRRPDGNPFDVRLRAAEQDQGFRIVSSSGNANEKTFIFDPNFNSDDDVVDRGRGDGRYAQKGADNTFTGLNTFSGSEADIFEGADSTKQIKLKNTNESDAAFIGQRGGMGIRMITGSATASGTVYDCSQAGSEDGFSILRRTYADGRYQQSSSDEALKYDIESMGDVGSIIDALRPVTYRWVEDEDDPKPDVVQYGAIAQEVEEVLPSAVLGEDGSKGIDLRPIVWSLVKEVQSMRVRLAELEGEQ